MVTKEENYYECKRCEINSLTPQRMIPCPRGECEAQKVGKLIFTTEIILEKDGNSPTVVQ